MEKELEHYLTQHAIDYVLHSHTAVYTVAESHQNEIILRIPGLRCKTLFLKDERGKFYLAGMPGTKRLNFKQLEQSLEVKKLTMGSPEELLKETNLIPGSVSIFGALHNKKIIVVLDEEVWNAKTVCFHPNIKNSLSLSAH